MTLGAGRFKTIKGWDRDHGSRRSGPRDHFGGHAPSEPNGDVKPATWHGFAINGEGQRPLFAFPGIWKRYNGPMKKDGPNVDIETFSFLTTTPNALVATINHERMPVLLTREDEFDTWLRGSPDEAYALAREYPVDQMRIVQEGFDKEDLLGAPPVEQVSKRLQ